MVTACETFVIAPRASNSIWLLVRRSHAVTKEDQDTIHDKCRRNGLLVSTEGSTVLLLPSLAIEKRTAARGLDILARSI